MSTDTHLDELEAAGMVGVATIDPELEYLFRHWLVHEAAYASLLKQERRQLHRIAGETLEKLYPDRLGELAPQLAQHFEEGEDPEKALQYLVRAGEHALQRTAFQEARAFLDRAAEQLEKNPTPENRRLRATVALDRVKSGWSFSDPAENIQILGEGFELAQELGDDQLALETLIWRVMGRRTSGEEAGRSAALEADIRLITEIAERTGDRGAQAAPLALTGMMLTGSGRLREGVENLESALPIMVEENMIVAASFAYVMLASSYAVLGEFDKAQAAADAAVELAKEGDPISRVDGKLAQGFVAKARGEWQRLLDLSTECEQESEALGAVACSVMSKYLKGSARIGLEQNEEARDELEKSSALTQVTYQTMRPAVLSQLGAAYHSLGDRDRAQQRWDEAAEVATRNGDLQVRAETLLRRGEALAAEPQPDWKMVLDDLEQSVALYAEMDAKPGLISALEAHASGLERAGQAGAAAAQRARAEALKTP